MKKITLVLLTFFCFSSCTEFDYRSIVGKWYAKGDWGEETYQFYDNGNCKYKYEYHAKYFDEIENKKGTYTVDYLLMGEHDSFGNLRIIWENSDTTECFFVISEGENLNMWDTTYERK